MYIMYGYVRMYTICNLNAALCSNTLYRIKNKTKQNKKTPKNNVFKKTKTKKKHYFDKSSFDLETEYQMAEFLCLTQYVYCLAMKLGRVQDLIIK